MSTSDSPQVQMVQVKRYDITLTLDDILTPLTQTSTHLNTAGLVGAATDPQVGELMQKFTDLVTQLKDVVAQINAIDPSLLASKPGPPPSA
ncbi:MAG TPA: hypothetical protein VKV73_29810 [Chloroflexota bacterium]|nr:hypothetical protein [Chloroflexota bacterium]